MSPKKLISFIIIISGLIVACDEKTEQTLIPKEYGNLRIDHQFYPKNYTLDTGFCNFKTSLPDYAEIKVEHKSDTTCFSMIGIPQHKATINLAYITIKNEEDFRSHLRYTQKQTERHLIMADDVQDTLLLDHDNRIFSRVQNLTGNVAEPVLFTFTDSTENFIFGRLIFEARPNYDSLAPVINYVKEDIYHLIQNAEWIK